MEEAAFLVAVQGIVRRVHVQHDALRLLPVPVQEQVQQQPAAIRPELPAVKPTDYTLPSKAFEFQSFRGTLCSHKVVVLLRGKLFIINQLYHETRPYSLPLVRNPG